MTKFDPPAKKRKSDQRSMAESFRSDSSEQTMFTLRMNSSLHKRLKVQAFMEERPMKEIIEELVADYLKKNEKTPMS